PRRPRRGSSTGPQRQLSRVPRLLRAHEPGGSVAALQRASARFTATTGTALTGTVGSGMKVAFRVRTTTREVPGGSGRTLARRMGVEPTPSWYSMAACRGRQPLRVTGSYVPAGTCTSRMGAPDASLSRTRRPLAAGSTGGGVGAVTVARKLRV